MNPETRPSRVLERLQQFDSCTVANAIEFFDVRLCNTGFADSSVRCLFDELPPTVGYAATVRIHTSNPPMEGHGYRYRLDWLDHVLSVPAPRVVVIEDLDPQPGLGSFIGGVHASMLHALHCIGVVTNGAVRDLPAARAMRFQLFAGNVSVSHAYSHVFDFGQPVVVGGLTVQPGDLIHGDLHGVQTVPLEIAERIPTVAERVLAGDSEIIKLCHSPGFALEALRAEVSALGAKRKEIKP